MKKLLVIVIVAVVAVFVFSAALSQDSASPIKSERIQLTSTSVQAEPDESDGFQPTPCETTNPVDQPRHDGCDTSPAGAYDGADDVEGNEGTPDRPCATMDPSIAPEPNPGCAPTFGD